MGNMSYSIKVFIYWQFDGNAGRMKIFEEMDFESELTSDSGPHNEIVKLLPGVQLWSTDALFWFTLLLSMGIFLVYREKITYLCIWEKAILTW